MNIEIVEIYKDGLISESFSLGLKSPPKGANSSSENRLRSVIWHLLLEVWSSPSEKLSEIKPPLDISFMLLTNFRDHEVEKISLLAPT